MFKPELSTIEESFNAFTQNNASLFQSSDNIQVQQDPTEDNRLNSMNEAVGSSEGDIFSGFGNVDATNKSILEALKLTVPAGNEPISNHIKNIDIPTTSTDLGNSIIKNHDTVNEPNDSESNSALSNLVDERPTNSAVQNYGMNVWEIESESTGEVIDPPVRIEEQTFQSEQPINRPFDVDINNDLLDDDENDGNMEEQDDDNDPYIEYDNIDWEEPNPEYIQALLNKENISLFKKMLELDPSLKFQKTTWEDDLQAVKNLSTGQQHHFKTSFRPSRILWRVLLDRDTKLWANVDGGGKDLCALIPLKTEKELLIFAAFPMKYLRRLYPNVKSLNISEKDSRNPSVVNAKALKEVVEELKMTDFFNQTNLFVSGSLLKVFHDGYMFYVENATRLGPL